MKALRAVLLVALVLHAATAAAQQAPALRVLASFQGDSVEELSSAPNGRFVVLSTRTSVWMYEVATRQSWKLVDGTASEVKWSPRCDRIAYVRGGDGTSGAYVWTMPVDANTGRARGPAQRVSTGPGEYPSISPDGRFIAFAVYDSARAQHLSIVPTTGGPERVRARFTGGLDVRFWSSDGRTIFLSTFAPGTNVASVVRVRVAGGAPEVIRSRNELIAGMTADRQYFVLVPAKQRVAAGDQATVIDTTGREVGHVALPVGELIAYDGVLGDSALVWYTARNQTVIETRPLAGGSARRLPLIGESDDFPVWSPDGNRLAFQVREGSRTWLAVVNADGAGARVYRDRELSWRLEGRNWSPDSRFLAFREADISRISLLDVAAGTIRTVFEEDSAGMWRWRADGRAIVWRSRRHPGAGIYETTLDGRSRQVLDWPLPNPNPAWQYVGDSSLFVPSDTGVFLRPLGPGQARRLGSLPPGTELIWTGVSNDGRWVGGPLSDRGVSGRPPHLIALFSFETGARTVLDVPFNIFFFNSPPSFVPDNSTLLVFGWGEGQNDITLFRVPIDGGTPRAVANVGVFRPGGGLVASASPDGRSVAYSVSAESSTSSLVLIDLRAAVPRAPSRPPRR